MLFRSPGSFGPMLRGSISLLLPAPVSLHQNSNTLAATEIRTDFIILSQADGDTSQLHVGAGTGDTST